MFRHAMSGGAWCRARMVQYGSFWRVVSLGLYGIVSVVCRVFCCRNGLLVGFLMMGPFHDFLFHDFLFGCVPSY